MIGRDVELSVEHVTHKSGHAFLIRARSGKSSKVISTFDGELGEKLPQLKDAWAQAVIDAIAQMVEAGP